MPDSPAMQAYLRRLRRLTVHVDPTAPTSASDSIRKAAESLDALATVDRASLTEWVRGRPKDVYTLALTVGLSQEKLKNLLLAEFGTASWAKVGRDDPAAVVAWLDDAFDLVASLGAQRARDYSFGDVLVARGTSRTTASRAGVAGKLIEDAVEEIVQRLGLPYTMRGRFVGRNGETGPADLVVPDFENAVITVACKGFDSTGSKLTAAVTEVQAMADVHFARQFVFAVVDGIGWNARQGDFRRMYALWQSKRIDGLYSLADLAEFERDLTSAARRHGLLP